MITRGIVLRRTFLLCGFCIFVSGNSNSNGFDDSILFRLTWPGPELSSADETNSLETENTMIMTTTDNEKYHCTLPSSTDNINDEDETYSGPSALELLQPLFTQLSCSYRLEQYWTYELCHGKYIKQYHDEKDVANSKKLYRQEFVLGEYDMNKFVDDVAKRKEEKPDDSKGQAKISTKKIDAQNLPYLEVYMSDGTVCDLNEKARSTRVLYICYPESKHEIYSFEEISTCEYEMIVLTPLLCSHPDYRLKENIQNDITCRPLTGSPQRPLRLEQMELENIQQDLKRRKAKLLETIRERFSEQVKEEAVKPAPSDPKLVKEFLSGEHCLNGGSGWWKFEYCHGKRVDQYHEEKDGKKTVINLGKWNKSKHLLWLEQNPHKRPKKGLSQKQISHYYTGGSICDVSGRQRQVEVKLKCKESATNVNAVSLYLLEPKPCEYILVVESSILCSFVEAADENGMFHAEDFTQ